jgi:hypothetical protein
MATTTPRIFGQSKPLGTVDTALYVVPSNRQAQITIFIANQDGNFDTFQVALVQAGQTLTTARYIAFNTPLMGNGVFALTGIGLNSQDTIFVRSNLGNLSFTATGVEFAP